MPANRTNIDPVPQECPEPSVAVLERCAKAIYRRQPRHPLAEWHYEPATMKHALRREAYTVLIEAGYVDLLEALKAFASLRNSGLLIECDAAVSTVLAQAEAAIARAEGE